MTTHNPHMIAHNPNSIDEPIFNDPGTPRRSRKANAGKWHRIQQQALQPTPVRIRPSLGRVLAEFGVLVGWVALWLLNGAATALGLALVGAWLKQRGVAIGLARNDWLVIGAVFHVLISAIEQHLWRANYEQPEGVSKRIKAFFDHADRLRLGMAVIIGALDSLSTAWYAKQVVMMLAPPLWGWNIVVAMLAAIIALSAEPMVINFAYKLRELIREYNQ